ACNRVGNDPTFYYAGESMIFDYNGDILSQQEFKQATLSATLDKDKQLKHIIKFNFLSSQVKFTRHL
ncbi:amidohydrolase, partial [Francisella tularensis subsp. holarctica]|nr:amidohydrolase [Francisella tularensis subsp. holarctica]